LRAGFQNTAPPGGAFGNGDRVAAGRLSVKQSALQFCEPATADELAPLCVALKGDTGIHPARAEISIGDGGRIPEDFVPEATVRLNLYARLLKLSTRPEIEDFAAELEDRFGSPPAPVEALLRLSTIAIAAASAAITMIEGGPAALAVTFREKPSARNLQLLGKVGDVIEKDGRYLIVGKFDNFTDRLSILELALAV
jgi:transcription-repair coupling factor (superfamily II helicase)